MQPTQLSPSTRSTTQHPRTCGPSPRQWLWDEPPRPLADLWPRIGNQSPPRRDRPPSGHPLPPPPGESRQADQGDGEGEKGAGLGNLFGGRHLSWGGEKTAEPGINGSYDLAGVVDT